MSTAPPLQYSAVLVMSSSISCLSLQSSFFNIPHRRLSLICPFWACDVLLSPASLSVTISLLVSVSVYSSLLCHSLSPFYLICRLPRTLILIAFLFPALCFPSVLMSSSGGGDTASSLCFSKMVYWHLVFKIWSTERRASDLSTHDELTDEKSDAEDIYLASVWPVATATKNMN